MLELLQIQVDTSRKDKDDLLKHDSERTETPVKPLSEEQALCKASETMLQASNTNELIHLETRHRASFSCIDDCRCPCHRPWNFAPSNLLRQLLGILFIRYRSLPVLVPKCDPECQRRSAATLKITYRFPMWSFARLGLFLSMKSGLLSPELRLYTTNVIPHEARLFHVVSCGDVESIAALLQANSASVRDIDHRDGRSALHVSRGPFFVQCHRLSLTKNCTCRLPSTWEDSMSVNSSIAKALILSFWITMECTGSVLISLTSYPLTSQLDHRYPCYWKNR